MLTKRERKIGIVRRNSINWVWKDRNCLWEGLEDQMKRKAVLENLARKLSRKYYDHMSSNKDYEDKVMVVHRRFNGKTIETLLNWDIVIFKLEFKEMKREMFSGLEVSEYDQEVLYKAVRQEYLEGPIWCRTRNAGDYLVEYMMIKEGGGNYVQVELRNFDLGVYAKCQ